MILENYSEYVQYRWSFTYRNSITLNIYYKRIKVQSELSGHESQYASKYQLNKHKIKGKTKASQNWLNRKECSFEKSTKPKFCYFKRIVKFVSS